MKRRSRTGALKYGETPQGLLVPSPDGTESFLLFYGGPFSNWVGEEMVIDGVEYDGPEQYLMAQKAATFRDLVMRDRIMAAAGNPAEQKRLGRMVLGFDPDVWKAVCRDVMRTALLAKFSQPRFKQHLLITEGTTIVEASPTDVIWGIGLDVDDPRAADRASWRGTNWLGECLMDVRSALLLATTR